MLDGGARCRKLGGAVGLTALALGASSDAVPNPVVLSAAIRAGLGHFDSVVSVDPRPIELRIDGTHPAPRHRRAVEDGEIRAIAALIIDEGTDTLSLFPWRACHGLLIPEELRETAGCPARLETLLAFEVPVLQDDGLWRVRMIGVTYEPTGSSSMICDVILREESDGQVVVVRIVDQVAFD